MSVIRIGVLGCANIAKKSFIPAIIGHPDFELVAIASRTLEKAESFTALFGGEALGSYEALVQRADVDVLYIPLPTGLHEEWVIKALESGKHCIVEKSLAMDYASALRMVTLARQKQLVLMEDFMFWYHVQQRFILDQLASGALGEFRLLRGSFGFPPLPGDNFRYQMDMGGGAIMDAAAYTLKLSQMVFGWDVQVVSGALYINQDGADIYGNANVMSKDGKVAHLSWGFDNFYQCMCEIWGSKAKLTADRVFTSQPGAIAQVKVEKQGEVQVHDMPADNHFANILTEFAKAVKDGNQYGSKADEVLNQARLIQELRDKSAKVAIQWAAPQ